MGIRPGAIETEMSGDYTTSDGVSLTQELRDYSCDHIPLGRWGRPDEVAKAVVCSDATYLSGATITLDGGWSPQLYPFAILRKQFPGEFE